jgi:hypothetical protein
VPIASSYFTAPVTGRQENRRGDGYETALLFAGVTSVGATLQAMTRRLGADQSLGVPLFVIARTCHQYVPLVSRFPIVARVVGVVK